MAVIVVNVVGISLFVAVMLVCLFIVKKRSVLLIFNSFVVLYSLRSFDLAMINMFSFAFLLPKKF